MTWLIVCLAFISPVCITRGCTINPIWLDHLDLNFCCSIKQVLWKMQPVHTTKLVWCIAFNAIAFQGENQLHKFIFVSRFSKMTWWGPGVVQSYCCIVANLKYTTCNWNVLNWNVYFLTETDDTPSFSSYPHQQSGNCWWGFELKNCLVFHRISTAILLLIEISWIPISLPVLTRETVPLGCWRNCE